MGPPQSTSVSPPSFVPVSQSRSGMKHMSDVVPHVLPCVAQLTAVHLHTPFWHVFGAMQFASVAQPHSPPALQEPPLHDVPTGSGGLSGAPLLQRSDVHSLPSLRTSVSSFTSTAL